jgi:hypothetical protein
MTKALYTRESFAPVVGCKTDPNASLADPPLEGLLMREDGSTAGCDGHVLFEVGPPGHVIEPGRLGVSPQGEVIAAGDIKLLLKTTTRDEVIYISHISDDHVVFRCDKSRDPGDSFGIRQAAIVGGLERRPYPDLSKIRPCQTPVLSLKLSADVFSRLAKFVKTSGARGPICFEFRGERIAVEFDAGLNDKGQRVTGLVMPTILE